MSRDGFEGAEGPIEIGIRILRCLDYRGGKNGTKITRNGHLGGAKRLKNIGAGGTKMAG